MSSPPCWSPTTARAGCPKPWRACSPRTARSRTSSPPTPAAPTTPPACSPNPSATSASCTSPAVPASAPPSTRPPAPPPRSPPRSCPTSSAAAAGTPSTAPGTTTPTTEPERPHGDPVQWLWLLHDDCEPDPGALAALLRTAETAPSAAIIGPKLRSWYDRRQLLEVGVSIARSGRRWTGLERREQDQGQHDQVRPVLSVSSAGMLVRRDVWEELGGFDRRLPLMRDDVDFCWRAQAAGHTVLIAPDAVMRHAEAASRERRPVDCAGRSAVNPHRVDKAGAVYTLLANTRGPLLPYVMLRIVVGTLLRTLAYLVGKVPGQAVDEIVGLLGVLLRPERRPRRPQAARPRRRAALRTAAPVPAARRDRTGHRGPGRQQLRRPRRRLRGRGRPPWRRRRVGPRRRRRRLPGDRAVRAPEADRPQTRPGALRRPARLLPRRLPRPARRRRAGRRRPAARRPRRLRPVGLLHRLLARAGHRRHPGRAPLPRGARALRHRALRLHRPDAHALPGRLGAAGGRHRLLRLPAAGRVPAAARLGVGRLRLPARRDRRAGRRAPGHRGAGDPAAADGPRGHRLRGTPARRRRRAARSAPRLAGHLGAGPDAHLHHRVHARHLADRPGARRRRPRSGGW